MSAARLVTLVLAVVVDFVAVAGWTLLFGAWGAPLSFLTGALIVAALVLWLPT